ncbi:MAG: RIP metalloprotease RseP [Candidatus Cloacimonadaceae bacterium]|nr:RIP metalloprotease RseP [Candidatus Cloacimonadaceae bacterium]
MVNLLLTIVALGVLITVHELGHFLMARAMGVGIEKFSIGFGKPIFSFTRNGIDYRIAWIPLGGYVKMKGEDPEDKDADEALSFTKKVWWKRALIAFSGPFANLIFGMLIFIISYMLPLTVEDHYPVVHESRGVWTEAFAPGDSIVSVGDVPIKGWYEFLGALSREKQSKITMKRDSALRTIVVSPTDLDSIYSALVPFVSTKIGEVFSGMPAWKAGLRVGDVITEVDSVPVADWYAMREQIVNSPRDTVLITIRRGDQTLTRSMSLKENIGMGDQKMIGISQYQPVKSVHQFTPPQALKNGVSSTFSFIAMNYAGLYQLILQPKQLGGSVGGPVMLATMSQQVGNKGFGYLLIFFASISLILMIMNLLPIPVLDGGHIMFCLIEGVIGRPVPVRIQALLQRVGLTLLLLLMVFAFYSDISGVLMRFFAGRTP